MGGGYSLDLAIADPKLKAAVINYGHLASDDANLEEDQRCHPRHLRRPGPRHSSAGREEIRGAN